MQWNSHGYYAHYEEFRQLARDHNPFVICVQKTLLKGVQRPKLKGYEGFGKNVDVIVGGHAKGGVGILVHESCPMQELQVDGDLQLVAVQVTYPKKVTVCSL